MGKEVTFGNILAILASIIIPLIVWGVSVETRFSKVVENTEDVIELKFDTKENHKEVMAKLHEIDLKLKDKQDRE